MDTLEITQPDDWHLHLRDGPALNLTVNATARVFARAIVMPNLAPPVTSTALAKAYRQRIVAALDAEHAAKFEPLMTLYLTDNTACSEIDRACESGFVQAVKLYPAGATTHSDSGVTDIEKCYPVIERMQAQDLPLLLHGEVTDPSIDIFDREAVFIERVLDPLLERFPGLRVVLEHITTEEAVRFVESTSRRLAATITPHHLLYQRNHLLAGGIRPHYYCLPVLKRERHRLALLGAACSGNSKFFLGTDSAPHPVDAKESSCGCAGIYSAHAALELYAEAFATMNSLERLEDFASHFGADFYGLPRNTRRLRLERGNWLVDAHYPLGDARVVPMRAGESIAWRVRQ